MRKFIVSSLLVAALALSLLFAVSASGFSTEGGNPHWWKAAGSYSWPTIVDRSDSAFYRGTMLNAAANLTSRSTTQRFQYCGNPLSAPGNYCTTPANCSVTNANAGTCPHQDGRIIVYDDVYTNVWWAAITSYSYYTWGTNSHFAWATIVLNSNSSAFSNRAQNSACHELAHTVGLDHRYDRASSCIEDSIVQREGWTCKDQPVCDYLSNDDIVGLDGTLHGHDDDATTKPPNMTYSAAKADSYLAGIQADLRKARALGYKVHWHHVVHVDPLGAVSAK